MGKDSDGKVALLARTCLNADFKQLFNTFYLILRKIQKKNYFFTIFEKMLQLKNFKIMFSFSETNF